MPTTEKILVVCLDNLGDTIMASSVLRPMKALFPSCELGLWVKKYSKDIFDGLPFIDHLHAADPFWDRSPGQGKGSIEEFISTLHEIKKTGYHTALILNAEWRRCLSVWMMGIPQRIGFHQRKSQWFLTMPISIPPLPKMTHTLDRHKFLFDMWAGKRTSEADFLPNLEPTKENTNWANNYIEENKSQPHKKIFIHPFSGDERKNWNLLNWKNLIIKTQEQFPQTSFFIVTSPQEKEKSSPILTASNNCYLLGDAGLPKIKALLKLADVFIGGDSGPGHLAAAIGANVISLFGMGYPERFSPKGRGTITVIKKDRMDLITVEEVFQPLRKMLSFDTK